MIPSPRLILCFLILALPLMLSAMEDVVPNMIPGGRAITIAGSDVGDVARLATVVIAFLAILDLLISGQPDDVEVVREISDVLSVGTQNPAQLVIRSRCQWPLQLSIHDDPGELCEVERMPQSLKLDPWKQETVKYSVVPLKRGAGVMQEVHLRFATRMKLWTRHEVRPLIREIRIYPDIRAVYRYELMARSNRLSEIGVRMIRMPGQGREFERLREYRFGDEIRRIDWKATARHRELISREFNVERNQNIVLMVDCGRFMRNETEGVSYLDRALNAAIMLSYIALGQGDNVSLMAFSNRIERFVRPVRGKPGIQTILRSVYDLEPSQGTADYSLALEHLQRVQRKRALVILITFVTDELQLDVIGESLRPGSLPYLPLCVLLQDEGLKALAESVVDSDNRAFSAGAAAGILNGQAQRVATLRRDGVMILDTRVDVLTERLINEYLMIKMRNLM